MLQRKEWLLWHQCHKSLAKSLQAELENVFLIKFIILYVCFMDRHDEHWRYLANYNGIHIHQILCNYDKYVSCCLRLPAFCEQPPREIRSISTDNQRPVAAAIWRQNWMHRRVWNNRRWVNNFLRVPGGTTTKSPSIRLKENVLQHLKVWYQYSALEIFLSRFLLGVGGTTWGAKC